MCRWAEAPGYGNGGTSGSRPASSSFVGTITLSYHIVWDSEQEYDFTCVEYDAGGGDWQRFGLLRRRSGNDGGRARAAPRERAERAIRFRFSSDGAWSDADGLYDSSGGCIVDSIRVRDEGTFDDFEDFEGVPAGSLKAGIWSAEPGPGFGMYSGLAYNLRDRDPCGDNFESQIVFWIGSDIPSPDYPEQYVTPFCLGLGGDEALCQHEAVYSPYIDMAKYSTGCDEAQDGVIPLEDLPELGGCRLAFTVYRDLPLANLVFYQWAVRKIGEDGCPGPWQDFDFTYYGTDGVYLQSSYDVSGYIGGNDPVQISFGIIDLCDAWYLYYGDCSEHTSTPYFDNVRLYRYETSGPQWTYRDRNLFQDNFPEQEYNLESAVRADAALDINSYLDPVIRPGDSVVVTCASLLGGGIALDPALGGPAVYLHVKASYIGPAPEKPNLYGPALAGSVQSGPATIGFNYVSDDGAWTVIQCDSARTRAVVVGDVYMVDLADDLFTRGYEVEYYFTARDAAGRESALPRYARTGPPYFEWTALPTLASEVLFVDDSRYSTASPGPSPAELYWSYALSGFLEAPPDRYHVIAAASALSNGPGSRAKDYQLTQAYKVIVWECGDQDACTISDGTRESDKSNDCRMLVNWMYLSEHSCGLWICGDEVASDLDDLSSPDAASLMNIWCGVDRINPSYFDLTGGLSGGTVTPLVTGSSDLGLYSHYGTPDDCWLFGGCPLINGFDVLEKTSNGKYALDYPDYEGNPYHAAIASETVNSNAYPVRTMWFGFSYQYIRSDDLRSPIDRVEIARDTFLWMQMLIYTGEEGAIPSAYRLAQNFPNPFNPATAIRYDVREKGLVSIRIYDVSGRLVRTLVNDVKEAGSWTAAWDGKNDAGAPAASGIYFCKMRAGEFEATRKLVMLR